MKRSAIFALAISAILIMLALSLAGCGKKDDSMESKKKVLLIGIDGMDPGIADTLIKEGKLPNFKKLKEQGYFSEMATTYPPHSPVAWASISTGKNPGKTNIFDFIRRENGRYTPELSLAKTRSGISGTDYVSYVGADPFWRFTSDRSIPTTMIRWPLTFPAEKLKGNMLSGLGVPDIKGFLSGYTYYYETDDKGVDKAKSVKVSQDDGVIKTFVRGPRSRKGKEAVEITAPMEIRMNMDRARVVIFVDGISYDIDPGTGWSPWIRAKFHVSWFRNVYGTFKVYVSNTSPFEMYMTTVQIDPENPIVPISYPKKYSSALAKDIGLYYTLGMPEETDGYNDGIIDRQTFLSQVRDIESQRDAMFWKEFERFDKSGSGIYGFVYDSSDRVQHVTWGNTDPDNYSSISQPIIDYYVQKDEFIGKVMSRIEGKNVSLFVFSDHGFNSFRRAVTINRWLVKNGYMALEKEGGEAPLFSNVDWSRTKAYSLGFNSIYINLKGRESQGIVNAADKAKTESEIASKLEQLYDGDTRVIKRAYRSSQIYAGEYSAGGPDIVVGFNEGYRMSWQNAVGGLTEEVVFDNEKVWNGDHLVDPSIVPGVIFSNTPLRKGNVTVFDIAPTLLDIYDIPIPNDMDGKSLLLK